MRWVGVFNFVKNWPVGISCLYCDRRIKPAEHVVAHRSVERGTLAFHISCLTEMTLLQPTIPTQVEKEFQKVRADIQRRRSLFEEV